MILNDYMNIKNINKLYEIDEKFSWDKIQYIDSFAYNIVYDDFFDTYSALNLGVIYQNNGKCYEIFILFEKVINLNIKKIGGKYNQILGFEIINKRCDGWEENQNYLINDYENGIISFSCAEIEVISVVEKEILY